MGADVLKDGFVRRPIAALYCGPRHCGVRAYASFLRPCKPCSRKSYEPVLIWVTFLDDLVKKNVFVMPVPDQVRNDVSGIQSMLELTLQPPALCSLCHSFPIELEKNPQYYSPMGRPVALRVSGPEKVDFGPDQGRSDFETTGVASLRRGFQKLVGGHDELPRVASTGGQDCSGLTVNLYV